MRKLFGTDGIRAVAGESPLDPPTIFATGLALASTLKKLRPSPRVVLGSDTRESSPWITAVIAAGLQSGGAEVLNAGVITTPGVAYLTRKHQFAAGIVISASHNPWQDNGIKVFGGDGYKLPDATELEIEGEIFRRLKEAPSAEIQTLNTPPAGKEFREEYEAFLRGVVPGLNLICKKIVIDCANGAAAVIASELFPSLG
jgi:phosphoglucosamine mutase